MKQRTFDFPEALLERLRIQADRDGISQGEAVRQALCAYLSANQTPYPQPTSQHTGTPTSQPTGPHVGEDAHQHAHQHAHQPARGDTSTPTSRHVGEPRARVEESLFPIPKEEEEEKQKDIHVPRASPKEIEWRVNEVWQAHLRAWTAFFGKINGVEPGSKPLLHPKDIAEPIRQALKLHDAELLGEGDRERWARESRVRAAGIGIFYDPWCTGQHKDNDARNGGKRYLEHWRPWLRQRGKEDPVIRYADLYFEQRDLKEARRVGA